MSDLTFKINAEKLEANIVALWPRVRAATMMLADTEAQRLEAYMKLNRPWTDRTNQAKATLNASVSEPGDGIVRITLAHGVDYGIWLEIANEGKYAIVGPTVESQSPQVMKKLDHLLDKVGNKL
jgi:hypothetical protein